jgi:hypothetical protein
VDLKKHIDKAKEDDEDMDDDDALKAGKEALIK